MAPPSSRAPWIGGVLLRRTTLRHWRTEPWQTALLVVILALGVAVYLSVRLANRAAVASFQTLIDHLLAKKPDDRYPSAQNFLEALDSVAGPAGA